MISVPTLLVGLGGIGSKVVDHVYGMIPSDMRSSVAVHAFDTNVNDISKLVHLGRERVTQTSTKWTVREYLDYADDSVKYWFPHEIPEIKRKTLTEGAGQIRAISRLAYRAAMEKGRLHAIEEQISGLLRVNPDGRDKSFRIMIVSSLAGGTGAGIFLQTAMYLRDLLETTFGQKNLIIRGAFLLPDVLIKTKCLDEREWENVSANAYACLKELYAIMRTSRPDSAVKSVTIDFEFKPNQTDSAGRRDHGIGTEIVPYEFGFLYDFENTSGNNIGCFENYLDQIINTTFLQLFSPITAELFSEEDNKILEHIRGEGENRLCGASVSSLVYPYRDIVEYMTLQWSCDTLSGKWLKIDELFEEEVRRQQRDLDSGIYREKPDIAERYPWLLESLATGEKPEPFFRNIHRAHFVGGEKGEPSPKEELFLAALEAEVERLCQAEGKTCEQNPQFQIDEGKLRNREKAKNEIVGFEANLMVLKERVQKFVAENALFLVNRAIFQDMDEPAAMRGEECRLNTWILGSPEPLHPVGIRYFLYRLQSDLEARIATLACRNLELEKGIRAYEKTYDIAETEEFVETAEDRIKEALEQNFIAALLKNHFKEFVEEYLEKSGRQLNRLLEYRHGKLKEKIFTELRNIVREMLGEWETYFRNLRETGNSLKGECILRGREHEKTGNPTKMFVLASEKAKKKAWEDISVSLAGGDIPTEISREIYVGQYRRFCARERGERVRNLAPARTEEMFRKDVLGWCRKKLLQQERLDLDVITALKREAELAGPEQDDNLYAERRIHSLLNLAKPFVPEVPGLAHMRNWGLHPRSIERLAGRQKDNLFGEDLLENDGFSPYEVLCYSALYGLVPGDLAKFSAGSDSQPPGAYYQAYKRRIDRLVRGEREVSPHLDKHWHLPAYMPDLNRDKAEQDEKRINRAFLLGVLYGVIDDVVEDGRNIWVCYGAGGGSEAVKVLGKPVEGKLHLLHDALSFNPGIVDKVLAKVQDIREADRSSYPVEQDILQHSFYKNCTSSPNMLEKLYTLPSGAPGNNALPGTAKNLLGPLLVEEIENYHVFAFGSHRINQANSAAANLLETLMEQAPAFSGDDSGSRYYSEWKSLLQEGINRFRTRQ